MQQRGSVNEKFTMRRTTLRFCGSEHNVAIDWFMSLPWLFLLVFGSIAFVALVLESPIMEMTLASWYVTVVELAVAVFACGAVWFLYKTVVSDPGVVLDFSSVVDEEQQRREFAELVGPEGVRAFNSWHQVPEGASSLPSAGAGSGTTFNNNQNNATERNAQTAVPLSIQPPASHYDPLGRMAPNEPSVYTLMDPHFCPVCRIYINKFDHHCGVIGAAIGERTMASFILFLSYAAVTCLLVFVHSITFCVLSWPGQEHFKAAKTVGDAVEPLLKLNYLTAAGLCFISLYGGMYCGMLSIFYFHQVWLGQHYLEIRRATNRALREGTEMPKYPRGNVAVTSVFSEIKRMVPMAERLRQLRNAQAAKHAQVAVEPDDRSN